jgi:phage-related protein
MSSGLRANSVFATFGVKTDDWSAGLQKMAGDTAKTLKQVERVGNKFGGLGLAWGASLGVAIKVASGSSPALAAALKGIKNAGLDVAAEIGIQFLPAMKNLAAHVRDAAKFVQSLSPELKQLIAHVSGFGVAALLSAGAIGKLSGLAGAAFKGLQLALAGLGKAWAAMGEFEIASLAPMLLIVAGIALLILGAGAFYKAWNTAGNGFKEKIQGILETVMGWGRAVGDFFVQIWENISSFLKKAAMFMLDLFASEIRGLGKMLGSLVSYLPDNLATKVQGWADSMQGMTGEKLLQGLGDVASYAWDKTKMIGGYLVDAGAKVGTAIADGVSYSIDGLKEMADDVSKKLGVDKYLNRSSSNQSIHRKGEYDDQIQKLTWEMQKALHGHGIDAANKATAFGDIGKTDAEVIARMTNGFSGFNDALSSYTSNLTSFEQTMKSAKIQELEGHHVAAHNLEVIAENYKESADRAVKAMDGFSQMASKLAQTKEDVKGRVMGASPEVSGMVQSATQGAQLGGAWGALAGVILELLSKSQQFADLLQMISHFFGMIANIIGQVLNPILKIVAGVFDIISNILSAVLTPVLQFITQPLEAIAPILQIIGMVFKTLGPIISQIAKIMLALSNPMQILADVAMKGLFYAVKYLALGVLYVAKGLSAAWNGIVGAISSVFHKLGSISVFGAHPLQFLDNFGDTIDKAKINVDNLDQGISDLTNATYDSADAAAAESEERWKNVDATKQLNEALSNVPQGIKVAALRFRASDAIGQTSSRLLYGSGSYVSNDSTTININVNGANSEDVISAIEDQQRRVAFLRNGSPLVLKR